MPFLDPNGSGNIFTPYSSAILIHRFSNAWQKVGAIKIWPTDSTHPITDRNAREYHSITVLPGPTLNTLVAKVSLLTSRFSVLFSCLLLKLLRSIYAKTAVKRAAQ